MIATKVSAKGQIVIPAELRRRYELEPGSEVEWVDTGQTLVLVPVVRRLGESYGSVEGSDSLTDFLLRERGKDREREDRKAQARRRRARAGER